MAKYLEIHNYAERAALSGLRYHDRGGFGTAPPQKEYIQLSWEEAIKIYLQDQSKDDNSKQNIGNVILVLGLLGTGLGAALITITGFFLSIDNKDIIEKAVNSINLGAKSDQEKTDLWNKIVTWFGEGIVETPDAIKKLGLSGGYIEIIWESVSNPNVDEVQDDGSDMVFSPEVIHRSDSKPEYESNSDGGNTLGNFGKFLDEDPPLTAMDQLREELDKKDDDNPLRNYGKSLDNDQPSTTHDQQNNKSDVGGKVGEGNTLKNFGKSLDEDQPIMGQFREQQDSTPDASTDAIVYPEINIETQLSGLSPVFQNLPNLSDDPLLNQALRDINVPAPSLNLEIDLDVQIPDVNKVFDNISTINSFPYEKEGDANSRSSSDGSDSGSYTSQATYASSGDANSRSSSDGSDSGSYTSQATYASSGDANLRSSSDGSNSGSYTSQATYASSGDANLRSSSDGSDSGSYTSQATYASSGDANSRSSSDGSDSGSYTSQATYASSGDANLQSSSDGSNSGSYTSQATYASGGGNSYQNIYGHDGEGNVLNPQVDQEIQYHEEPDQIDVPNPSYGSSK